MSIQNSREETIDGNTSFIVRECEKLLRGEWQGARLYSTTTG